MGSCHSEGKEENQKEGREKSYQENGGAIVKPTQGIKGGHGHVVGALQIELAASLRLIK